MFKKIQILPNHSINRKGELRDDLNDTIIEPKIFNGYKTYALKYRDDKEPWRKIDDVFLEYMDTTKIDCVVVLNRSKLTIEVFLSGALCGRVKGIGKSTVFFRINTKYITPDGEGYFKYSDFVVNKPSLIAGNTFKVLVPNLNREVKLAWSN